MPSAEDEDAAFEKRLNGDGDIDESTGQVAPCTGWDVPDERQVYKVIEDAA